MPRRAYFPLAALAPALALSLALVLALSGCAGAAPLSDRDAAALTTLAAVAGPTSNVPADAITSTECWLPSDHLVDDPSVADTVWKVLCRVHYTDDSGDRYQDATCIGDFALQPQLDHCYRWAHYDFAPTFPEFPAVAAG
jgi:hypothetical protein